MPAWLYVSQLSLLTGLYLLHRRVLDKKAEMAEMMRSEFELYQQTIDRRVVELEGHLGGLISIVHEQGVLLQRYQSDTERQIQQLVADIPSIDC